MQWWSYSDSSGWPTRENNLKVGYYSASYSAVIVLKWAFSEISGWAMAHPAHPLDSPCIYVLSLGNKNIDRNVASLQFIT
jgi:hypothetical protein